MEKINNNFYDIRNELKDDLLVYETNYLIKFLKYKNRENLKFDCDTCKYSRDIYKKLWGYEPKGNWGIIKLKDESITMGMDTINSFLISFNWFCKNYLQDILYEEYKVKKISKIKDFNYEQFVIIENYIKKNFGCNLYENINNFAKVTHTIGNMILVPKSVVGYTNGKGSFNITRATKEKDFWDLSLKVLSISKFPFEEYCDMFLLKGIYVDENYKIKEMFKNHLNNDIKYPMSIDNYNEFLVNAYEKILIRNEIINNRLRTIY